ncbi:hypothetical protein S245_016099 [Arachis hypogaea]|uniref:ribonuclease H n=1 Tax=Arachis hypogaea TaxID=3818 RepID=A0A445D8I6_ARAHY|nr:hypothetical protein Ahy_A05g025380 [Arachis hypogaea]
MKRGHFSYYAVRRGRQVGIYTTWEDCNEQVLGYSHAEFKGFHVHDEATAWISRGKVKPASQGTQNSGGGVRCQIGGNTPLPSLVVGARGVDDEGCSSKARRGSGDGQGVITIGAEHPFLLVEDMKMMLM